MWVEWQDEGKTNGTVRWQLNKMIRHRKFLNYVPLSRVEGLIGYFFGQS